MMGELRLLFLVKQEMKKIGVNYHYLINDEKEIKYPYVTGEYIENDYTFENGAYGGYLFLECWHRGNVTDLLKLCETIKQHFRNLNYCEKGFTCNISYANKQEQRQEEAKLKKIEIQLDTMYWKGDN